MKTSAAHAVSLAHSQKMYDAACKKLFAEKEILAWIMQQAVARQEDYDVLQAVFIYLGGYRAEQKDDALKLLNAIRSEELSEGELRDILEKTFHIAMTKKVDTEVEEVCNWSSALLERGVEKGRQEGALSNKMEVLLKLLKRGFTFEEAADIAGAETPSEIEYLRQHLPAQS